MSIDAAGSNYDVIVVGFGIAGACAAIAAAEKGAKVLVVDRAYGGGASALSGGVVYAGGGTPYQKAAGYDETPDNMFKYLRQEAQGAVDDETLREFCDTSAERLAWLEHHGAQFAGPLCEYKTSYPTDRYYLYFSGNEKAYPYAQEATPAPRGHRQVAKGVSSGKALWTALRDAAIGLGVVFKPLTSVDQLVMVDGEVRGIRCRASFDDSARADGWNRFVVAASGQLNLVLPPVARALNRLVERRTGDSAQEETFTARSVILAAGGFILNRDLLRRHAADHEMVSPLGTAGDDGKGIMLGVDAGGVTDHLDKVVAARFLSPPSALLEGVVVGVSGERIGNEDLYGCTHTEIMIRRFGGKGFLILDSSTWKRARAQVRSQTPLFYMPTVLRMLTIGHRKAATLGDLAAKMGISVTGLQETIDGYNSAIASGVGDPGHKAPDLCRPIVQGPFYGVDISVRESLTDPTHGFTLGGLKVDGRSGHVLTHSGSAIPGLYAAGRTAVGVCSKSYVSGLSLADCIFSGKRAGDHAASTVSD